MSECNGCLFESECRKGLIPQRLERESGELIVISDISDSSMISVVSGVVGVWLMTEEGERELSGLYGATQTLGWPGMMAATAPPVEICAVTPCTVCRMPTGKALDLFPRIPDIGRQVAWAMLQKDFTTFYLTWSLEGPNVTERVLRLLLAIAMLDSTCKDRSGYFSRARQSGYTDFPHKWVNLGMSHELVARMLRTGRSSVTRALDRLEKDGYIRTGYKTLGIDLANLKLAIDEMGFPRGLVPPLASKNF